MLLTADDEDKRHGGCIGAVRKEFPATSPSMIFAVDCAVGIKNTNISMMVKSDR